MVLTAVVPVIVLWGLVVARTTFDMGAAWYALGLVLIPTVLVGGLTSREMARRWARERGVVLDGDLLDLVHRQVLRARVGRTLGVFGAFAVAIMVTGYYNTHTESFAEGWDRWSTFESNGGVWALAALGYAIASGWVERTKPRLAGGGSTAVLDRRRLPDLVDLGLTRLFVVYAAAAVMGSGIWLVARVDSGSVRPSPAALVPLFAALVALAIAEWTVVRPQRATDDEELAYEELTRTATVNALVGASIAMLAMHAAACVSAVWDLSPWVALPGVVFVLFGYGIWFASGTKLAFRTRRIDALRSAA